MGGGRGGKHGGCGKSSSPLSQREMKETKATSMVMRGERAVAETDPMARKRRVEKVEI